MRRADRLFQIVQHLRGGRLVTAQKLGEWLEVSERTIYRDIADLQSTGVPIDGEAGVGYLMRHAAHRRHHDRGSPDGRLDDMSGRA
jgi:predicted DNA-binding transcriptional regulator YafY